MLKKNEVRRQFHPDSLRVTVWPFSVVWGCCWSAWAGYNYLPDNGKTRRYALLREEPVAVERG